ncbi:MAG: putative membrane protein [Bacteriovoracaceae bacterium]|jgi:uncharacterized membrane protein
MRNLFIMACLALSISGLQAETLNCGGTEPFWNLTIDESSEKITYDDFSGEESDSTVYKKLKVKTTSNDLSVRFFKAKKGLRGQDVASAFVSKTDGTYRSFCSDGMSDFNYQYEIFANIEGKILQGCCESRLAPRLGGE